MKVQTKIIQWWPYLESNILVRLASAGFLALSGGEDEVAVFCLDPALPGAPPPFSLPPFLGNRESSSTEKSFMAALVLGGGAGAAGGVLGRSGETSP